MARRAKRPVRRTALVPAHMPSFDDRTAGPHAVDADGWSTVGTKETKRMQRLRKYANTHIPSPPPLPPRPDLLARLIIHNDRQSFAPPLVFARDYRRGPLFSAANRFLHSHNTRTFANFNNSFTISTLERRPWHDSIIGPHTRLFAIGRVGLIAKCPLFFSKAKHELVVLDNGRPAKFEDWLSSLPASTGPDILGAQGYKKMNEWYRARGAQKKCRALDDVPMGLVLLHAMGEVRHVEEDQHRGFVIDRAYGNPPTSSVAGYPRYGTPMAAPAIPAVDRRLMCLNKALRGIAEYVLRHLTIKTFDSPVVLMDTILNAPPPFLNCLTRVQLTLTDEEYFKFFQVRLPACGQLTAPAFTATATSLSSLPTLRCLILWFQSPISQTYTPLPWHTIHHVRIDYKDKCPYPCRRTMVDYILTFAFPHICEIQHVNIAGYVKTSTRNEWLNILRDHTNRAEQLATNKEKMYAIQNLAVWGLQVYPPTPTSAATANEESSPICNCRFPCFNDGLNKNLGMVSGWWDRTTFGISDRLQTRLHTKAIKEYVFDFDDDVDTSGMDEQALAVRHYEV